MAQLTFRIALLKYPFGSKQENKNEHTEYHGIVIPFKIQVNSKRGRPTFLLFGTLSLVLYLHVSVKAKFFW